MDLLNGCPHQKITCTGSVNRTCRHVHAEKETSIIRDIFALRSKRVLFVWNPLVYVLIAALSCLLFTQTVYADNSIPYSPLSNFSLCYDGTEGGNDGVQISGTVKDSLISANARPIQITLDGTEQWALSTDLYTSANISRCYPTAILGVSYPKVSCALHAYPLGELVTNNQTTDITALQAAIWHFSDDFNLSESEPTYARYQEMVNEVNRRFDGGQCEQAEQWQFFVEPTSSVHYLEALSSTSFKSKTHEFRLTLRQGDTPIAQSEILISTDAGTLSWNGQSGSTITAETDFEGVADIFIRSSEPSIANIQLSTSVELSPGTRIDAGPYEAKLAIDGIAAHPLQAQAKVEWRAGNEIAVRKFHDKNGDSVFNQNDELIGGRVEICESGTAICSSHQIDTTGLLVEAVSLTKRYDVCTTSGTGYQATTPECIASVSASTVLDFGVITLPALLIDSYHDLNGNGLRDTTDQSLDGWPFQVERWSSGSWVAAYSGSTASGGRYAVPSIGLQSVQVLPQLPQSEDEWYTSSGESRVVSLFDQKLYTATFGNVQSASIIVNQSWEKDSVPLEVAPTATRLCLRRTGPGVPQQELIPRVGVTQLQRDEAGFYCYDNLINTITIENLWPGEYAIQHRPPEGWGNSVLQPSSVTLSSGREFRTVQASNNIRSGGFSGRAWGDSNRNGLRDAGELGLANVLVRLYANFASEDDDSTTSTLLKVANTDSSGSYHFSNLLPGNYFLEFLPLDSYTIVAPNLGGTSADEYDSDVDPITGRTPARLLFNGVTEANWDIGLYINAGTYSFEHLLNGQDADRLTSAVMVEPNDAIVFSYVLENNDNSPIIWETLSDEANGNLTGYCKLPLEIAPFASARCELVRPAGSFPNGKSNVSMTSVAGLDSSTDIAWYTTLPATGIGGVAWADTDQDGVRDNNEPKMPNVEAELFFGNGQPTGRKSVTDSTGEYTFDNLTAQAYYIEFKTPAGFFYTQPRMGGDSTRDSDVNQMTDNISLGRTEMIQLSDSEVTDAIDVGLLPLPSRLWSLNLASTGSVSAGAPITYTINYVNHGYSQAYEVEIIETVPEGTVANLAQSTLGWICTGGNISAGTECFLPVGNVLGNSAQNAPVTFVVNLTDTVDASTQISNNIRIRDNGQSDPFPQSTGQGGGTLEPPTQTPPTSDVNLFLPLIMDIQ